MLANSRGSGSTSGPDWPRGDAAALKWWLEEGGEEKLGQNVNKWLGVIDHASLRIWGAATSAERRAFHDTALAAIRQAGVLVRSRGQSQPRRKSTPEWPISAGQMRMRRCELPR